MISKLRSPFQLCSISRQNEPRGVSKHADPDCVIVTLNKNRVSRYKVTDQRAVGSWSCGDGFSCAVVYDAVTSKYVGLHDRNSIRQWKEDDPKLESLKKLTFASSIWRLVSGPNCKVFVVHNTGQIHPLAHAVEHRKEELEDPVLPIGYKILDCFIEECQNKLFAVFICTRQEGSTTVRCYSLEGAVMTEVSKLLLPSSKTLQLSGLTLRTCDDQITLLSLWSDGQLCCLPLLGGEGSALSRGESVGTMEGVKCGERVALLTLDDTHIAVYGSDPCEEGAILLLYNLRFRLVQARQHLKLYTSPPLLWGPFGAQLVLAMGNCLMAAQSVLGQENLAAMMGAANKKRVGESGGDMHTLTWGQAASSEKSKEHPPRVFPSAPESVGDTLEEMARQGLSESVMAQNVLPRLLGSRDVEGLSWCLEHLKDIPEAVLLRLVTFCLRESESIFLPLAPLQPQQPEAPPVEEDGEEAATIPPESPLGGGRRVLLDRSLAVPFNAGRLLPELRRHLAPQDATLLLQHMAARLWHGDPPAEDTEHQVGQLLAWSSALLDTNYQHCLLSMDAQVLRTLTALSDIVDTQLGHIEALRQLEPVVRRLQQGKHVAVPQDQKDLAYSIETIQLY